MSNYRCSVQGAACRAVLLGIILVALPETLVAQGNAEEVRQRIERLERRAAELVVKADSVGAEDRRKWADSLTRIEEGGFRILAPHDLAGSTRESARLAASALARGFGDSIVQLIREERFLVFPDVVLDSARADLRMLPGLGTPVLAPTSNRVEGLALNLIGKVYQRAWQRFDPALREWLAAPLSPTLQPERMPGNSYLDLVTSSSPPAMACFRGEESECVSALGLDRPADRGVTWYSESGRRELVGRMSQVLRVGVSRDQFERCTTGLSDSDCRDLLARIEERIPPPLTPATRASFLRAALATGGPQALTRLLASASAPLSQRLGLTSERNQETLVGQWRLQVIAARPRPIAIGPAQAWMAVMWTSLLLMISLRSSRWR